MAHADPAPALIGRRLPAAAPELATLALLDITLDVCTTALLAEHPTLDHDLRPDPEPLSLREARRLIAAAHRLRCTVVNYRNAVLDSLVPRRDEQRALLKPDRATPCPYDAARPANILIQCPSDLVRTLKKRSCGQPARRFSRCNVSPLQGA